MTASKDGGRRNGGGNSSPPGLEQAVELSMGVMPKELEGMDLDDMAPETRRWAECSLSDPSSRASEASISASNEPVCAMGPEYWPVFWPEWFLAKLDLASRWRCWLWTGALTSDGYAQAKVKQRFTRVHRWAWIRVNGPLATGFVLHHDCGERRCVNPAHLRVMSQADHWRLHRNEESQATHCPHGHPWDETNTYWYRGRYRQCRACAAGRQRTRRAAA